MLYVVNALQLLFFNKGTHTTACCTLNLASIGLLYRIRSNLSYALIIRMQYIYYLNRSISPNLEHHSVT